MNASVIQAIAVFAIVIIGFYVFLRYGFKYDSKSLTLASLLVVLSIILSSLSLQIPLFGAMSLKIGFSQMPLMIAGTVLGPAWAFICGIVQDFLDIIINPSGFPFFGFTLNKVLISVLPALWSVNHQDKDNHKTYKAIIVVLVIMFVITSTTVIASSAPIFEGSYDYLNGKMKALLLGVILLVTIILTIITIIVEKKGIDDNQKYPVSNWLMGIILVECTVQLMLTPMWLDIMYGISFYINLLVRLCKASFNILLNLFIGEFILKTISKIK